MTVKESVGNSLSVLMPALFPPGAEKVPNMGGGLILRAIERHVGQLYS